MTRSLFDLVAPIERTNQLFRHVRESRGFTAARRLMDEIFAEFRGADRSFVREFQTEGFSPRVFELALFAYLREQGHDLDPSRTATDFVIRGTTPVAIEAATPNPPQDTDQDDVVEQPPSGWPSIPRDLPAGQRELVFQGSRADAAAREWLAAFSVRLTMTPG